MDGEEAVLILFIVQFAHMFTVKLIKLHERNWLLLWLETDFIIFVTILTSLLFRDEDWSKFEKQYLELPSTLIVILSIFVPQNFLG